MRKLTTMPAGLICTSIGVCAAKEEEPKKLLVKTEQLPMYTAPPLQSKYVEEQPGHLQMGFASVRTTIGHYINRCTGIYLFAKNGIMDAVQFGKDAYVYLKNPPQDFLPKIGVITVSGLTGLVSARKGSRFKKIAYPLGLATLGATVCYPVQSVKIAKVTGKKAYTTSQQIYEAIKSFWTRSNEKESLPESKEKTKLENYTELEIPAMTNQVLKHSVPLPADLHSETKTRLKPTSGNIKYNLHRKIGAGAGQIHKNHLAIFSHQDSKVKLHSRERKQIGYQIPEEPIMPNR
ncbi:MICOS complex subunit MIC27 isoform X2 [Tamandua tetradactyla]|uniref:MICOS complex subunit MIC27 isoform X2 n=1 Tax=Tamandua tetradactyla TaxID=48850 RepID=UPI004053D4C1